MASVRNDIIFPNNWDDNKVILFATEVVGTLSKYVIPGKILIYSQIPL